MTASKMYICNHICETQPVSEKMLMEIKKKKRIILEDESSDWLHNWMTASSLDVIGKKILLTGWFPKYGNMKQNYHFFVIN